MAVAEVPSTPAPIAAARRFLDRHPRASAAWTSAKPFVKAGLYGAAFAGGALLFTRLFGSRIGGPVADKLGRRGGEGFAQGVAQAQATIARLERGARFG